MSRAEYNVAQLHFRRKWKYPESSYNFNWTSHPYD